MAKGKKTPQATPSTHVKQLKKFEDKKDEVQVPEPRLNWMGVSRQWDTRVKPGAKGLTLDSLNIGLYGDVPTEWPDKSRNPRGAVPVEGLPPVAINIKNKADLWASSAAELYEEGIQRRWAPATDIPWATLSPLPQDIERSICQVCTELMHYANIDIEIISSWQYQMSYGYHEVKQFLATASLDAARRHEAFRKRALANGGGIGLESVCQVNRLLLETRGGWTETVTGLVFSRGLFALTMCRYLERFAYNEAERKLYQFVIQDLARLLAYGIDHLSYALSTDATKKRSIQITLAVGDGFLARDLRDPVLREALAIIFGAGVAGIHRDGMDTFYAMLDSYVKEHLALCTWLKLERTLEQMPAVFQPDKRRRD